jgi:dTDP-4-amino-4,6-dideoxygalactose transaminase
MDRATWISQERARVAAQYDSALGRFDWLAPPITPAECRHGYQAYVCLFRPEEPTLSNVDRLHDWRNRLMLRLEERGVSTRQGTHAPVLQGFYRSKYRLAPAAFPNATIADRLSLTLPLYPAMTADEQAYVIDELGAAFEATK